MNRRFSVIKLRSRILFYRNRIPALLLILVHAFLLHPIVFSLPVQADDKYWIGESGRWDDGANWNPVDQPQDGDNVFLTQTDATDRNIEYRNSNLPNAVIDHMEITSTGAGHIILHIEQDRLEVEKEFIGYGTPGPGYSTDPNVNGSVNQTGGAHVVNEELKLGTFGTGIYNLSGGTLTAGRIEVGDAGGKGIINQTGGVVEARQLVLAAELEFGNEGVYNLSGGSLTTEYTSVGDWHEGYFNQNGGTHETKSMRVGHEGDGWYNLNDGNIVADTVRVGWDYPDNGTFTQKGGNHTINDELHLGWIHGDGYGEYHLIEGTLESKSVSIGNGTFIQSGGSHDVGTTLSIQPERGNSYHLTGGTLAASEIINEGDFNYSSGELNADITNNSTVHLSGNGKRKVNGDVFNNGNWDATDTTVSYEEGFVNNDAITGQNAIQYFEKLTIGDGGSMTGSGNAPWFVNDALLGVSIDSDQTVNNIFGESGFNMYYNPFAVGNEYLGGLTYDLIGEGVLDALDGIADIDQYFLTDTLILDDTFAFDAWWAMDSEPEDFNFDILFFHNDEWNFLGGDINLYGSSTEWETLSFVVPEWAQGIETQIKFMLADLGDTTDPTVYFNNISSSASVPEPQTMFLLGIGLIGLAGWYRKKVIYH